MDSRGSLICPLILRGVSLPRLILRPIVVKITNLCAEFRACPTEPFQNRCSIWPTFLQTIFSCKSLEVTILFNWENVIFLKELKYIVIYRVGETTILSSNDSYAFKNSFHMQISTLLMTLQDNSESNVMHVKMKDMKRSIWCAVFTNTQIPMNIVFLFVLLLKDLNCQAIAL